MTAPRRRRKGTTRARMMEPAVVAYLTPRQAMAANEALLRFVADEGNRVHDRVRAHATAESIRIGLYEAGWEWRLDMTWERRDPVRWDDDPKVPVDLSAE